MKNIYDECPILENERFLFRKVELSDTKELLKVYSDKNALPFFNSDNCHQGNFYIQTEEDMEKCIESWNWEYEQRGFVRLAIIDKAINEKINEESNEEINEGSNVESNKAGNKESNKSNDKVIGTIELFNRRAEDYFNNCGLLRLDLRSDYEQENIIYNILSVITNPAFELFECTMVATKARNYAVERIAALKKAGYFKSEEKIIGQDGTQYGDYWVNNDVSSS